MMVLTAVILLAAFMALTAMLARVGDLAAQTRAEGEDPFAAEAEGIIRGLTRVSADYDGQTSGARADLEAALAHIEAVSAARGHWVEIAIVDCQLEIEYELRMQAAGTYARFQFTAPVVQC